MPFNICPIRNPKKIFTLVTEISTLYIKYISEFINVIMNKCIEKDVIESFYRKHGHLFYRDSSLLLNVDETSSSSTKRFKILQ